MKNIKLKELKEIEVSILVAIDKICTENNLKYSLADGSLIGAIRHKGFIPWDDDIDIMMPRDDYEKLKEIMTNNPVDGLKFLSHDTCSDYYYPYAKVVSTKTDMKEYRQYEIKDYGVFVDIFPINGTFSDKKKANKQVKKIMIYQKLLEMSFHEKVDTDTKLKYIIKSILTIYSKALGYKRIIKKIDLEYQKNKYENAEYVGILYGGSSNIYKKEFFNEVKKVPFEGHKINVIKNYDKYLTDLYGDYMKLPPKEKQVSNHKIERLKWK